MSCSPIWGGEHGVAMTITGGASIYRLLSNLDRIEAERALTLARLSTGRRITRASDDPAGLIAFNALNAELASVDAAIANNDRTKAILDTADGALAEVSSLVSEIERLAVASGGNTLSAAELAANQSQIDSAVESIDRIVNSASFNGEPIFNGENQITATLSVADANSIKDVRVHSRNAGSGSTALTVNVTTAATRATTSGTVVANVSSPLSAATTLSIAGKDGTATVTLTSGSNIASVVTQINASKGLTGVSAAASGTQLKLASVDYGSGAFVSVSALSGDADVVATAQIAKKTGADAVIKVNGQSAMVSGTEFYYSGNGLSLSATLVSNTTGTRTITVTGGGATFQIGTSSADRATIGLGGVGSYALGRADLGYLSDLKSGGSASLSRNPANAALIAKKAVVQVATAAARIGGFSKYQVEGLNNALQVHKEGLSVAASQIGDADIAEETSRLQRQNVLASASMSLLGLVSTQQANVLSLLG